VNLGGLGASMAVCFMPAPLFCVLPCNGTWWSARWYPIWLVVSKKFFASVPSLFGMIIAKLETTNQLFNAVNFVQTSPPKGVPKGSRQETCPWKRAIVSCSFHEIVGLGTLEYCSFMFFCILNTL
jgi:hypothetical protein